MTTPGSDEDPSSNNSAGKQGILSFFQNIKTKEDEHVIEVVDSDDEMKSTGNQEPGSKLRSQSQSQTDLKKEGTDKDEEDVKVKDEQSSSINQPREVADLPESATNEKRRQKEEQRQRREELKKQKEADKQRREEEKLKKEEEKKLKKEEERRIKAEEKLRKENEKKAKEEEKLKRENEKKAKEEAKERSQARIGNFFKKVTDSNKPTNVRSDYERFFLPFYSKEGVVVSRSNQLSPNELNTNKSNIDSLINQTEDDNQVLDWLDSQENSIKTSLPIAYQAVSLLQQMTSKEKSDQELQGLLSLIPHKYIKFYENVRPPYIGTYSKDIILPKDNPFSTKDTGYNYDYDSDLEWVNEEEEVEGGVENLESGEEDEEDEEEEASEGEFDGFLDAEDNGNQNGAGKKKFIGPLIPIVSLRNNQDQLEEDDKKYFNMVAVQYLVEEQPFPIDPNQYIKAQVDNVKKKAADPSNDSSSPSVSPEKKNKSLISEPKDLLKLFDEIQDSTFSLGTVTEIAQKNLPIYSKQTIKNTVKEYAVKPNGGSSRKWAIKDIQYWDNLRSACNNN